MKYILGIDTSCYTTSVSVTCGGEIIRDERKILDVVAGGRGLRQSEAVFQHIKNLPELIERLEPSLLEGLEAVAVSRTPRGAQDSYMPVFQAGYAFARAIARARNVPLLTGDHQTGHIYAGLFTGGMLTEHSLEEVLSSPLLAVHLSGGTLEVLEFYREECRIVASTGDISAGQLIDRVGVALGAPFPAGPTMERWAGEYSGEELVIPSSVKEGRCSFSGAETKALSWVGQHSREAIAYSVFMCVARTLEKLLLYACERTGCDRVLLAGGVISAEFIRQQLQARMARHTGNRQLYFCGHRYASDNAVGIALWGGHRMEELRNGDH